MSLYHILKERLTGIIEVLGHGDHLGLDQLQFIAVLAQTDGIDDILPMTQNHHFIRIVVITEEFQADLVQFVLLGKGV